MTRGALLGAIVLLTAGCSAVGGPDVPDPGPAADELARALESGRLGDVANQPDAQQRYDDLLGELADLPRTVEVASTSVRETASGEGDPRRADATLRWAWELPEPGGEWTYETTARLVREGEQWVPEWESPLVHPRLRSGRTLEVRTLLPERGDVVGAGGRPLVTERPVTRFGITRERVDGRAAVRSARELAELVGIEPGPYVRAVRSAGERAFVEAIVLRREEVPVRVGREYVGIEGAFAVQDELPLGPTAEFAAPILGRVGPVTAEMIEEDPSLEAGDVRGVSGLQARYDDRLAGTPGLEVLAVAGDGRERRLHRVPVRDGEDLVVSLDERLQLAAERILSRVGPAAALVAVRPSDGAVLAAANGPGTAGVNVATYGQAAPGSTFKVVSALALLRDGRAPSSPVQCPPTTVVDGREFENYDDYPAGALGRITLADAVASSCNTAFIAAADGLADGALADAAASLGLGIDHDLGFPAYFGQVPPPESETEAAADMIGQGGVLASPMVMATVMASVQEGSTVVPWLVDDVRSAAPEEAPPLAAGEVRALRSMLRGVVTAGSGAALADVPGQPVLAKTGTAEFDRDGRRLLHAWMVAAQGDLAVAAYVDEGESGSRTAGPLLEAFLR